MTSEILFVFCVIGVAGVLFASGKARLDVVALMVVLALTLGGTLTAREALAGFGDPVVVMIAGLLVIGEMLTRTGIAHAIGEWMSKVSGGREVRLLVLMTLTVALVGCFMTNTAIVAIFIPVVVNIARKTNLNSSRLLLPLAYAALVSGMLTLIATPPNLIVSSELDRSGYEAFAFFSFTPIGTAVLLVLVSYMVILGRHLLPGRRVEPPVAPALGMRDILDDYGLLGTARRLRVLPGSSLVGRTLAESEINNRYSVVVTMVERHDRFRSTTLPAPSAETEVHAGDVLVILTSEEVARSLARDFHMTFLATSDADRERWVRDTGVASVLIHPESRLIGSSLRESGLRSTHGLQVLGVRRKREVLDSFLDKKLQAGDSMLVVAPWKRIAQLQSDIHDFVVLSLPHEIEQVIPRRSRAPVALLILLGMVLLSALGIVPVVIAVILAALAAVFTRCLSMEQGYRSIQWNTVVLVAGLLPIATAMQKTGGVDLIVDGLVSDLGASSPHLLMTALFFITAALGTVLSNSATAVLVAPIAIGAAEAMNLSPYAFAMTVAIAASSAFITPVASPAVTLIVGPGKYRVLDFVKVGVPMLILTWLVTIFLTPLLFPF